MRVLQLSMRRAHDLVGFCALYELEDVLASVTATDRVEIADWAAHERARRAYRLVRATTGSRRVARAVTPLRGRRLKRDYDLFFPTFNNPFELFALAAVPDWRARSRVAACFICEPWAPVLPDYLLELLADFDHVFVGIEHAVDRMSRTLGRPCTYLPFAADVLRFAPHSPAPPRCIDVCNLGRRSPVTHAAFLQRARAGTFFYYHDTVRASGAGAKQVTFSVGDAEEHRLLLAALLRRTRYYVANRARANESQNGVRDEISSRFYEGIAAGTVLLGEAPQSAEFQRLFDWPDAVVHLPFDSPDAGDLVARLDADPERIARIRRENVRQAALRHDWLHRIQAVFQVSGLPPTPGMRARAARLRELAGEAPALHPTVGA